MRSRGFAEDVVVDGSCFVKLLRPRKLLRTRKLLGDIGGEKICCAKREHEERGSAADHQDRVQSTTMFNNV